MNRPEPCSSQRSAATHGVDHCDLSAKPLNIVMLRCEPRTAQDLELGEIFDHLVAGDNALLPDGDLALWTRGEGYHVAADTEIDGAVGSDGGGLRYASEAICGETGSSGQVPQPHRPIGTGGDGVGRPSSSATGTELTPPVWPMSWRVRTPVVRSATGHERSSHIGVPWARRGPPPMRKGHPNCAPTVRLEQLLPDNLRVRKDVPVVVPLPGRPTVYDGAKEVLHSDSFRLR